MTAYGLDVISHYYDPVKAPYLRAAVLPAIRSVENVQTHVERHWLHGPHLRIGLRGPKPAVELAALQVAAALREHVSVRPSKDVTLASELLRRATLAGKAELVPPPYTPIWADNTIAIVEPRTDLVGLLGSTEAVDLRSRLLALGVPAIGASVARLGERGDGSSGRVWLALTAMAAHAGAYPLGLGAGHQSFLSHLEDFLLFADPDGTLRATYTRQWERHAGRVTDLVARMADGRDQTPVETGWLAWSREAWEITAPAFDRGELPSAPGEAYTDRARRVGDDRTLRQWDPDQRTEYSEYHKELRKIDFQKAPYEREFVVYRFNTNMLYLLLGVCDLEPAERYLAAFLVSRAAEQITGLTWRERLAGYLAAQRTDAGQVAS
ncbi:lantibiotic dehydratase C-terminal domain-containing protein [Hamadaea tsunoensis]|uniref:lantibiotic dehydratase C-terminal domain-containing protein n=1 Tax=Hamadaea tsunoensis TaxID=53368 RepID=UPI000408A5B5|nr:lantibiotic dehydratase C-terminal domain-containing protein [Hamadaea tsunoensis]